MPSISQIAANFATSNSFTPPVDFISTSPLTLARYTLRNLDRRNLGWDDFTYLSYEGGFITEIDKINIKLSDFNLKNNSNLFVLEGVIFRENINMLSPSGVPQTIRNIKPVDSYISFAGSSQDNNALTLGDWRKYLFEPGMIMLWNGTFTELETQLPHWKLCAPPHAGQTFWGTTVPNLLGRFIPGSIPKANGDDFTPVVASNTDKYQTDDVGGYDFVTLTTPEMTKHKHDVTMIAEDPEPIITGQAKFVYSGGDYTAPQNTKGANNNATPATAECSHKDGFCFNDCRCARCSSNNERLNKNCAPQSCIGYYNTRRSKVAQDVRIVNSFTMKSYNTATVSMTNVKKPKIKSQSEDSVGGSRPHENRPKYYALAYIIYVGEPS